MLTSGYDYLTGTIRVGADAPSEWAAADALPFWERPNEDAWGAKLSRVLFHESIHFWQFLSSAYVANLVAQEWARLVRYEQSGEITGPGPQVIAHASTGHGDPFSPAELVESWARFWDVHTRSPARIIAEESIPVDDPAALQQQFGGVAVYTHTAFDTVMQVGQDCEVYGRPFRWLLEQLGGHSAYAQLIFPIVTHAAFSAPDPVGVFVRCIEQATDETVREVILSDRSGSINLDWLNRHRTVVEVLILPLFAERQWHPFTGGFDMIRESTLSKHPVFREYPDRFVATGYLKLYAPLAEPWNPFGQQYANALVSYARADPVAYLMGLPGQPFYRTALGNLAPPAKVAFGNLTWYARRWVVLKIIAAQRGEPFDESYEQLSAGVEERVSRFRAAEKAVSLGLPPDAFESQAGRAEFSEAVVPEVGLLDEGESSRGRRRRQDQREDRRPRGVLPG